MFNPIALAVRESSGVAEDGNNGKLSHYRTRGVSRSSVINSSGLSGIPDNFGCLATLGCSQTHGKRERGAEETQWVASSVLSGRQSHLSLVYQRHAARRRGYGNVAMIIPEHAPMPLLGRGHIPPQRLLKCKRERFEHFRLMNFEPLGRLALSLRKCDQTVRNVGCRV